jgi:hypothetical protein
MSACALSSLANSSLIALQDRFWSPGCTTCTFSEVAQPTNKLLAATVTSTALLKENSIYFTPINRQTCVIEARAESGRAQKTSSPWIQIKKSFYCHGREKL